VETGLARAKGVHLICSPKRARGLIQELCGSAGLMIWEPVPDLCTPEHREEMFLTLPEVDVVSPNAEELSGFFADMEIAGEMGGWVQAEFLARRLLEGGVKSAVVVRMGAKGCLVAMMKGMVRLPAVYGPDPGEDPEQGSANSRVVDPTGGGNTFIGGMGVGLVRGKGPVFAAAMGSVAASFAIEQMGLPTLENGQKEGETWNGVRVEERMRDYLERLKRLGVEYED
jgi:sugar/nucleoside kinase (ribokinase family)